MANHRIELPRYVNTDVSIVFTRDVNLPDDNLTLYFGLAGYKDEIMIGTDFMYEKGGMYTLKFLDDMWYTINYPGRYSFGQIQMYTEIDSSGNLIGYFGEELPLLRRDFPEDTPKKLLLTPIEYKLLKLELKKDRKEFLDGFNT